MVSARLLPLSRRRRERTVPPATHDDGGVHLAHQLSGPADPAFAARWSVDRERRTGFFTDTSICIGCKACEVACKEWNHNPRDGDLQILGSSYDNTGSLGASTWRHVAFIEQTGDRIEQARESGRALIGLGMPVVRSSSTPAPVDTAPPDTDEFRWLMSSDVCKHCTHAACLDVCPTGALFRTEFDTVVVQQDVCNGCGYCVSACPYGVIDQRPDDGRVFKCTMCYDRIGVGQEPACAKACPTESIQFGDLDELRAKAQQRVDDLHAKGLAEAKLYGDDPSDGVGGAGAFFLLMDEPEVYGLPPDPVVTTRDLPQMWRHAAMAAGAMLAGVTAAFLGRKR
jgi:formate dehydrogenase iron-sulfur subunit